MTRVLRCCFCGWFECFVEECVEQPTARGLAGDERGFQLVAEGQQLVDFCDDAVLFAEGGHRYGI